MKSDTYLHFWRKNPWRNLWQHPLWADFQKLIGRSVWLLERPGASALVIRHALPKKLCWLEVPRGPLFEDRSSLKPLMDDLKKLGKKERAVFIRLSPFEEIGYEDLRNAPHDHHPQTSLTIALSLTNEEILKQMKPKGRYNIKVAQKHGVTVEPSEDVEAFHRLLSTTGSRDRFGIHPKSYYQNMLTAMPKNAQLLLARVNGEAVAGGIFVYLDDWGIYYYGASSNKHRQAMAPYLVQWTAIQEAKRRGCRHYDFLGIAPEGAKNHPWAGVTDFKKKFGGHSVNYPSAKEMVLRPFWYWAYRIYKKIRG